MRRIAGLVAATCLVSPAAWAYRPFDTTLPEVVETGKFDLEFGPLGLLHEADERTWIAPQARFNYGIADGWEAVIEGQHEHAEGGRSAVKETALSLKHVVREGLAFDAGIKRSFSGDIHATEFRLGFTVGF
jgi:hypothetical protein